MTGLIHIRVNGHQFPELPFPLHQDQSPPSQINVFLNNFF